LRLFEPEDYEKTYVWHNDFELQKSTCGPLRFISKEIEKNWVLSKATHNQTDIYLAICLIESDEMIGWYSINNIDYLNRKCHCGGVVIGDKRYRDGNSYHEAGKLAFDYIINELNMNRVTGSCLREQILSRAVMEASYWKLEGIERQSVYKGGCYHDVCRYAILREEYLTHLRNGDYEDQVARMAKLVLKLRKDFKDNK
jgi:RimJ/RimL family protein N-acetyltransferase